MVQVVVTGSYVQDQTLMFGSLPRVGETRIATALTLGCGGKGFNQAVACARQAVDCLFIGAVGRDTVADQMQQFAAGEENLSLALEFPEGGQTGIAQIHVGADGRNQIGVFLGANDQLSIGHIDENASMIRGARMLVTQLECNVDATRRALTIAREGGAITILNPAPINPLLDRSLLDLADIVVPNETELGLLLRAVGVTDVPSSVEALDARALHNLCQAVGVPTIIVTLGERGAVVCHNSNAPALHARHGAGASTYHSGDRGDFYEVPAHRVKAIDTTGAGDAFTGGLAAGFQHTRTLEEAVQWATVVAGLSVTRRGTAPAMPKRLEVEQALQSKRG